MLGQLVLFIIDFDLADSDPWLNTQGWGMRSKSRTSKTWDNISFLSLNDLFLTTGIF